MSATIKFEVHHPGELAAGLRPFRDTVTVACESGEWGGAPGEFESYMEDCLKQWFDGAHVGVSSEGVESDPDCRCVHAEDERDRGGSRQR